MLMLAFKSRSCLVPHSGQIHVLILKSLVSGFWYPQLEQIWLEAKYRSTETTVFHTSRPYTRAWTEIRTRMHQQWTWPTCGSLAYLQGQDSQFRLCRGF